MPLNGATSKAARHGADSVFRYIQRTAEHVPDGVRWETLTFQNQPQYAARVFNGVGGIPLFLADYYRLTGDEAALELALGGARWCTVPAQLFADAAGLRVGSARVALGWLRLAEATSDPAYLTEAKAIGGGLPPPGTHPVLDYLAGAAGEGTLLLRLAEATQDAGFLDAAIARGQWLAAHAVQDSAGCRWPARLDQPERVGTGFAHGTAGPVYFLLLLHQATGNDRWRTLAAEGLAPLTEAAAPDRGGLNWPRHFGSEGTPACQWCWGSPGIGLVYARAYEILGDDAYLATARAAAETTFAYGDVRRNPTQCHGLAGNAELFIELYRLTHDQLWLERARDFGQRCLTYRTTVAGDDVWQADEPGLASPDFMCGAAGTGHFFLRLMAPDTLRMPLQ